MSVREAQLVTAEAGGFAHQLLAVYTFEALGAARGTNSARQFGYWASVKGKQYVNLGKAVQTSSYAASLQDAR